MEARPATPMSALAGVRVLELGSTVAGPFCGRLMADFGADVVKVEPPSGDPVRTMGKHDGGRSLYAASILRNKHLIAVDLQKAEGQDVIRRILPRFDIVVENFRPGTLERWGLGWEASSRLHPRLIMVRISGFGQTGPYRERPGYGFLGDAVSGFLNINGYPDRPPVRAAVPVTDMLTALYAAYGAALALIVRDRTGRGQFIDAALYESAFSLMESHVPAFDRLGESPKRTGSRLAGSTPNNLYRTKGGATVAIAAASDSVFRRLAAAMNRIELLDDPRFATALSRTKHEDEIDAEIEAWTSELALEDVERRLQAASVPASRVYTMDDVFGDPHYEARGMVHRGAEGEAGPVAMVAPVPKLSETPGAIRWGGRRVGQDTLRILGEDGAFDAAELEALRGSGAILDGSDDAPCALARTGAVDAL